MGIITAVVYTISAQMHEILVLRELHLRYWHMVQGGLMTAVVAINERAEAYVPQGDTIMPEQVLYEGPWEVDPRHSNLRLRVMLAGESENQLKITGALFSDTKLLCAVAWHLRYDSGVHRWRYMFGEQIYEYR